MRSVFLKKIAMNISIKFFSSNFMFTSSLKICILNAIKKAMTKNCRTWIIQLMISISESQFTFIFVNFSNKCFRSSIIRSIISDDCHQSASKFINLQNVHYRFCQFFIRMLFEKKFERYKHFSKSKLSINEVCDNIHKDEMIERDSNIQNNENLNLNLEILKKIIFNLICSLFHHFFEKDSFENVNISSQIFHKILEKRIFDRLKKQVYIQNVFQQFIVEFLLNESKKWFFFSHEASFILINNWTNKKKKIKYRLKAFFQKFLLLDSFILFDDAFIV